MQKPNPGHIYRLSYQPFAREYNRYDYIQAVTIGPTVSFSSYAELLYVSHSLRRTGEIAWDYAYRQPYKDTLPKLRVMAWADSGLRAKLLYPIFKWRR